MYAWGYFGVSGRGRLEWKFLAERLFLAFGV